MTPRSSAPLSPFYLWLPVPTCLPRRPHRRLRILTIVPCAGVGLRPCTRDSATPVVNCNEAHWLWFIFIQAHRFWTRTAYSPPRLAGGQASGRSVANRPIRPVGLSPTSATTFTGCCGAAPDFPLQRVAPRPRSQPCAHSAGSGSEDSGDDHSSLAGGGAHGHLANALGLLRAGLGLCPARRAPPGCAARLSNRPGSPSGCPGVFPTSTGSQTLDPSPLNLSRP